MGDSMSTWLYRSIMAGLIANVCFGVYVLATLPKITPLCINGLVMVQNKAHTMYVQQAVFVAEQCIPIDTD